MDVARCRGPSGFTLIELLVTIAVVAILATLAVPSFQGVMMRNRAASEANQVLSLLMLARSEAIKRNTSVSLCPSPDGVKCDPDQAWADGVMLFVDDDEDDEVGNGVRDSDAERVIEVVVPLSTVSTISPDKKIAEGFTYNARGRLAGTGVGAAVITVRPKSGDSDYDRKVTIDAGGRVQIQS